MVEELELKTELVCGEVKYNSGDTVTARKVNETTYMVFLRNGWWAVDEGYFKTERLIGG